MVSVVLTKFRNKSSIVDRWPLILSTETKTPATNRIIGSHNNNNCTKAINGNGPLITYTPATPLSQPAMQRPQKHSNAMPAAMQSATEDGSVMKKIISLSMEQFNNIENSIGKATATVTATRPDFVPEKLNFSAYEQFEGEFIAFAAPFIRIVWFRLKCVQQQLHGCNQYALLALSFAQRRTVSAFSIWLQREHFVCAFVSYECSKFNCCRTEYQIHKNTLTQFNFPGCCFSLISSSTVRPMDLLLSSDCMERVRDRERATNPHQIYLFALPHISPSCVWWVCEWSA